MSMPIRKPLESRFALLLSPAVRHRRSARTAPVASNIGAYADSLFRAYCDATVPGPV
jgi:hypothetical protein